MRTVLIPHHTQGNIYIRELGRAYASLGWQPVYGAENLLECNLQPDLLHLHWPEELYRWRGEGALASRVRQLKASVQRLKDAGVPVAWTIHNLAPHDHKDEELDREVYDWIATRADCIHHHCEHSRNLLAQRYPATAQMRQIVVPHGHYLSYPNETSQQEARRKLGIPARARVLLQFGQIRGYKGLDLLLQAFDALKLERKFLLVAGQYSAPSGPNAWRERLGLAWRKRTSSNFLLHGRSIDSDRIQDYVNAADAMVLSHTSGLNSGVAILGMSFGKPMVGPELGCLGWVLGQGPNLTYAPGDAKALTAAMHALFQDPDQLARMGEDNRNAAARWRWEDLASGVLNSLDLRA